jgi:hypothetical protein
MALATIFLVSIAVLSIVYITAFPSRRHLPMGSRYPLGPPGKPLVGNLPDVSIYLLLHHIKSLP